MMKYRVPFLALIAGVIFLALALVSLRKYLRQKKTCTLPVQARVIEVAPNPTAPGRKGVRPCIQFYAGEQIITHWPEGATSSCRLQPGQIVDVWLNPQNPNDVRFDPKDYNAPVKQATLDLIGGAVFIAVAIIWTLFVI